MNNLADIAEPVSLHKNLIFKDLQSRSSYCLLNLRNHNEFKAFKTEKEVGKKYIKCSIFNNYRKKADVCFNFNVLLILVLIKENFRNNRDEKKT